MAEIVLREHQFSVVVVVSVGKCLITRVSTTGVGQS